MNNLYVRLRIWNDGVTAMNIKPLNSSILLIYRHFLARWCCAHLFVFVFNVTWILIKMKILSQQKRHHHVTTWYSVRLSDFKCDVEVVEGCWLIWWFITSTIIALVSFFGTGVLHYIFTKHNLKTNFGCLPSERDEKRVEHAHTSIL